MKSVKKFLGESYPGIELKWNETGNDDEFMAKNMKDYALYVVSQCEIQASNGLESVSWDHGKGVLKEIHNKAIKKADKELSTRFDQIKKKIEG